MKRIAAAAFLILSSACITTSLTPAGEKVRVTSNPEAVRDCTLLGEVKGSDHLNGGTMGQGLAEEQAHRRLKNNAAEMGADTVLMTTASTGMSGSTQRGEAYRCTASTPGTAH